MHEKTRMPRDILELVLFNSTILTRYMRISSELTLVDMRYALDMLLCNSIYLPYGKFDMRFARCLSPSPREDFIYEVDFISSEISSVADGFRWR